MLHDDLSVALDDGTGHVSGPLQPLFDAVCRQPNPLSAILWLRNSPARQLLHQLAVAEVPLTLKTFSNHPHPLMATHLRDLLIRCGALPPVNRDLVAFQDWLTEQLPALPPATQPLLRAFATWHHLHRMRDLADHGRLTRNTVHNAQQQITVAAQFLQFLDDRNITYTELRQPDVDSWLSTGPTTRYTARTFVRWAGATRRLPPVRFANRPSRTHPMLDQHERLRLLDTCFQAGTAPQPVRIIGILLLLYAQPVTRISRLPLSSVSDDGVTVSISFGATAEPLPTPVTDLLRRHLTHRPNMSTAANTTSAWLFPGVRPGQPITANWMMVQLRSLGIPLLAARNSALRQLVLDMPAAVAAQALGFSPITTDRHATQSGATWAEYVVNRRRHGGS